MHSDLVVLQSKELNLALRAAVMKSFEC